MIALFDFDDSFTFNIYSDLKKYLSSEFGDVEVYHWSDFESVVANTNIRLVVLGPGPGNPSEYLAILPHIRMIIEEGDILVLGICLGHQLIFKSLNYKIDRLVNPVHGQSERLKIPPWKVFGQYSGMFTSVQNYNSLFVLNSCSPGRLAPTHILENKGRILIGLFQNVISYQFHPESVGTSCPKIFYQTLLNLRYNNG